MRALLLDEQAGSRKKLGEMLPESVEKVESNDVESVLAWTRDIDLAIVRATFETEDPPEGCVTLATLRKLLEALDAPFVVLASEAAVGSASIRLRQANYLFTFGAPLDVRRLQHTIEGLVGSFRRRSGTIADESLDALLIEVVKKQESGVLTANRGVETRRVVVDRGRVVFCTVERTGEEDDQFETFDCGDEPSSRGAWDAVLELYLWPEGEWQWFGATVGNEVSCALPISISPLRTEGKRRGQEWALVKSDLPPDDAKLVALRDKFPPSFPNGDLDRMIIERISAGSTVGQLRAASGRQDFPVCRRVVDLLRLGLLERPGTPRPRVTLEQMSLAPFRSVRLAKPLEPAAREALTASEAFIASRLSGGEQLVEDVLSMSPLPVDDVTRSLATMVERGIVAVRDLRGEQKSRGEKKAAAAGA